MARQSEKESAEKYALESLKIFIWWLREKGERVEEHIYMDGSKGEQHFKEGNLISKLSDTQTIELWQLRWVFSSIKVPTQMLQLDMGYLLDPKI